MRTNSDDYSCCTYATHGVYIEDLTKRILPENSYTAARILNGIWNPRKAPTTHGRPKQFCYIAVIWSRCSCEEGILPRSLQRTTTGRMRCFDLESDRGVGLQLSNWTTRGQRVAAR